MNIRLRDAFVKQKWKKKLLHPSLSNYPLPLIPYSSLLFIYSPPFSFHPLNAAIRRL